MTARSSNCCIPLRLTRCLDTKSCRNSGVPPRTFLNVLAYSQRKRSKGRSPMRKSMSLSSLFTLVVLLFGTSGLLLAQQDTAPTQQPDDKSATAAPDNTGKNQRDRNASEPTADQQKENDTDRELARQIRRA